MTDKEDTDTMHMVKKYEYDADGKRTGNFIWIKSYYIPAAPVDRAAIAISKLSDEEIKNLTFLYQSGTTKKAICKKFGFSRYRLEQIITKLNLQRTV